MGKCKGKDQMAKEVESTEAKEAQKPDGEQMDLIDVLPENCKALVEAAKLYKKYLTVRLKALAKKVEQKQVILELVKAANIQPANGGKIKFKYQNVKINVTPSDYKVSVTVKGETEE